MANTTIEKNEEKASVLSAPLNIYIIRYKRGNGAVKELNFTAKDDEVAKEKANKFCKKHGMHLVYVKHFLCDLESEPKL